MTSQPRDKTRDSTKHDTAKFGIDLYSGHNRGKFSRFKWDLVQCCMAMCLGAHIP